MIDFDCVVIKVGSSLVVEPDTYMIQNEWIKGLVQDILYLKNIGKRVIIVTSGAIATAKSVLLPSYPLSITQKQAFASIGQVWLMQNYNRFFTEANIRIGQILIDKDDTQIQTRRDNLFNTIQTLIEMDCVPIINENDTLAVDEIKIGDNDTLSAFVACVAGADLLVLLSDIDGLYDSNPKQNIDANFISRVDRIDDKIKQMAGGSISGVGTGGMVTKIQAAEIAKKNGIRTIITRGNLLNPIQKLLNDSNARYTLFI